MRLSLVRPWYIGVLLLTLSASAQAQSEVATLGAPVAKPTAKLADKLADKPTAVLDAPGKHRVAAQTRTWTQGKNKLCCGYPLSEERGFRYTFYWMADQERHDNTRRWRDLPAEVLDFQGVGVDNASVDIYTPEGVFLGSFIESFVEELKMEGSGWLSDGRVINYAGRCSFGVGTCFEVLEPSQYPYGRGAHRRPLVPFRSVAVDRKLVPIGEPLYAPEFDGLLLPDGTVHDGCLRADDTGGAIRKRLIDFFVLEMENFMWVNQQMWHDRQFTPHIEDPRCEYLRDDPGA